MGVEGDGAIPVTHPPQQRPRVPARPLLPDPEDGLGRAASASPGPAHGPRGETPGAEASVAGSAA
jgi:hypothetical protein